MPAIKRAWNFIRDMLGFRINSQYVKNYLNDANIKSSIYMSFIVIILEIWMIFRNANKYISNYWNSYTDKFDLIYTYTGLYALFIICSAAVLIFAISYLNKKNNKGLFITNLIFSGICILYPFLLFKEHLGFANQKAVVSSVTTLIVYFSMPLLGGSILWHSLYRNKTGNKHQILSMAVITCFAIVCLAFGIKVGYSDFANPTTNVEKLKMITCFLTMVIFVACLLIWKPYISILILVSIFIIFMNMLKGYNDRPFLEADEINYITFLISLTMIAISIYQQRVTEAKKDEKLLHDAIFDRLVDINNEKYLCDTVNEKLVSNPNFYNDKQFLFVNLSNFRIINNQKGFEEGDKLIIKFSELLKEIFNNDLVARQADDHFIVFTTINDCDNKINNLNDQFKKLINGLFINIKIGIYKPKDFESPYTAIDKARYACGLIKKNPEILFSEYDDKVDEKFKKKQYIVNHLDEAIEKGWIRAYYQPVVWSDNNELCGAEALARWIDPVYGFLSPADFIPVLEDNRLIHKLDEAIIEYVCSNMRRAIDEGRPVVPVSINFSRLDFELMDVVNILKSIIEKYNIDKKMIHVEITESALSENVSLMRDNLLTLKNDGYSIWLDDFGSGYSSLNVLKDFTFDVVKIDMTFLSNFETNEKTKDILDCIIQLANRLGMKTLTEGVETIEESSFLKDIGCGRLQGYLFGKPFELSIFEQKIKDKELVISNKIL